MKKKKLMSLLLVLAMVCSMAAGCGGGKETSGSQETKGETKEETKEASDNETKEASGGQEEKVLTMMNYIDPANTDDPMQSVVIKLYEQFTEETGIKIEYNVVPWDQLESKIVITNRAGAPSDLVAVSSQKLASLVNSGALMPLDDMIDQSYNRDDFSNAVWAAGTYSGDNKVYCMLQSVHTRGIWYNTDYVKEAPKTWDEIVSAGQKAMSEHEGIYGFGFWGGKHYASVEASIGPLTWAGGGTLTNDNGSAAWDNDAVADAIKFMSDCVNAYKITPETCLSVSDYNDITQQFAAGNIAMIFDGSYAKPTLDASDLGKEGKFDFAPVPAKTEGGLQPHFSNGWAWGIPSKSKHPELAWEFIKWFSQKKQQLAHSKAEGGLPITIEAQQDKLYQEGLEKKFVDNLNNNAQSMDPFVYYQEGLEELAIAGATYCLDPGSDLRAVLKESQEAFNQKYYAE